MAPHVSDTFSIFLFGLTILISPFLGARGWVGSLEDTAVSIFQPRRRGPSEIIHQKCMVRARVPTQAFIYSTVKKPLPTVCWGLGILPYIRPTGPWRPGGLQSR